MNTTDTQHATRTTPPAQPELPMFQAGDGDLPAIRWLENYLRECQDWRTATALLVLVGKEDTSGGPRWIRMLAEASDWVISGQKGYKHLEHCTAEEVAHFIDWMTRQGSKMIARAERVRHKAHSVFG